MPISQNRPLSHNPGTSPGGSTGSSGTGGGYQATVGNTSSNDYKKTFFDKYPQLKGKVVVHHAIEQQIQKRYPNLFKPGELHSLENLRGIPKGSVNNDIHLSKIRKEWNRFYKAHPNPTRDQVLAKATEVDLKYGSNFRPPVP